MAESLLLKLQGKRLEAKTLFYERAFCRSGDRFNFP
jgi:hypothetical protein